MTDSGDGVAAVTSAGRLVGGRYRLARQLGAGGFGSVWQAHDEVLGVDVAVKEVQLPPAASPEEHSERLLRAQREARHAARLRDHPNVVGVHDVVIDGGVPWTVMQLVVGRSLEERIAREGPLPTAEAVTVAEAVLAALGAAHQAGIVHRDVKPANIMLADDGGVLLADFGIAVQQDQTALTASGAFIGSVDYLAPERAHGSPAAPAGDLFSLGATLYQAVEGRPPFRRDTPVATLTAVLFEQAPPMALAGPLAPLIDGLLAKDPNARLSGAQAAALLAEHRPPLPHQPLPPARPAHPPTALATQPVSPAVTQPVAPLVAPPTLPGRPGEPGLPAPTGRRGRLLASVLVPAGLLAVYGVSLLLTGGTVSLEAGGNVTPQTVAAINHASGSGFPLYSALGIADTERAIGFLSWVWLVPALLALVCAAALPHRPYPALRRLGYVCALPLPCALIGVDFTVGPDDLARRLPPTLQANLALTFGAGWWLLHAAAVLTLAALIRQHVRTARADRAPVVRTATGARGSDS
ncbi:serine/threonine-protein kinase [Kitasatospora sp. NPDC028055]|uniref:serine/threonine-protein kinase n=1 Tax=Kitasatospora sp. NPDC028055 TaxID=3155653 RepID=UPI003405A6C2